MWAVRRLVRLIWGAEVDRALRPVLVISFVATLSGSTGFTFLGIWAVKELGASPGQLSIGFLVGAIAAGVTGYVGGHLSDHYGRRRMILIGESATVLVPPLFLLVDGRVAAGIGVMILWGAIGSFGGSASFALVADLVPPEKHEQAYAAGRVASNLGVTMGPPIGSVLLLVGGWSLFFPGVSVLATVALAVAWRLLPRRGRYAPDAPPERGSLRVIVADRLFLVLLVANTMAQLVYVAYETVLPVSLVETHGLSDWQWGLLVAINPVFVTLCQLRLTRALTHVPAAPKFSAALLLMGLPFLLLGVTSAIAVIVLVIVVFVVGEMLWVPTSQSLVAGLAPEDVRGAYMGAFGSTGAVGFALSPFLGFQVRGAEGDFAMWTMFAGLAVAGAVLVALASRAIARSSRAPASALLEA